MNDHIRVFGTLLFLNVVLACKSWHTPITVNIYLNAFRIRYKIKWFVQGIGDLASWKGYDVMIKLHACNGFRTTIYENVEVPVNTTYPIYNKNFTITSALELGQEDWELHIIGLPDFPTHIQKYKLERSWDTTLEIDNYLYVPECDYETCLMDVMPRIKGTSHRKINLVKSGPKVIMSPQYVLLGQAAEMTCRAMAHSNPSATVRWYHNGKSLKNITWTIWIIKNAYKIPSVSVDDFGDYKCEITDRHGTGSATVALQRAVVPYLKLRLDKKTYITGDDVTLICNIQKAMPKEVTVVFTKDNVLVKTVTTDEQFALLNIKNIQQRNEGRYNCTATNSAGRGSAALYVYAYSRALPTVTIANGVVTEGDDAELVCKWTSQPERDKVGWYKDGRKIEATYTSGSKKSGKLKLKLRNVHRTDTGDYYCCVRNVVGWKNTSALQVLFKPEVTLENINVKKGSTVTLKCTVVAYPVVKRVTWYKNGEKYNVHAEKKIHIQQVQTTHAGIYKCEATNTVGTGAATAKLFVVPYTFKTFPKDQEIKQGDDVIIPCSLHADVKILGDVNTTWLFNDKVIAQNGELKRTSLKNYQLDLGTFTDDNVYDLKLSNVSLDNDGKYTCQANTENISAYLTVYVEPSIPKFLPFYVKKVNRAGDKIKLTCWSEGGIPTPMFSWLLNKVQLVNSGTTIIVHSGAPSKKGGRVFTTITIRLSPDHHLATLECKVENKVSKNKTLVIGHKLSLKFLPVVKITAPRFLIVGSPLEIVCEFKANPPGKIYAWYKDSVIIASFSNKTLLIKNASISDVGSYMCIVSNYLGSTNGSIYLTINTGNITKTTEENNSPKPDKVSWTVVGIPIGITVIVFMVLFGGIAYVKMPSIRAKEDPAFLENPSFTNNNELVPDDIIFDERNDRIKISDDSSDFLSSSTTYSSVSFDKSSRKSRCSRRRSKRSSKHSRKRNRSRKR